MNNSEFNVNLSGQFTLRKRCALTGNVKQEVGPFSNLITDAGLNRIGTAGGVLSNCYVGTGTVPPAVTDTNMSSFKVTANSRGAKVATAPVAPTWFSQVAYTFTFNAGTINGNITEVGIGWAASPVGALWSRELIVDSAGNPIAITVLENEILEVVYALRQYFNPNDFTGSFVLNGITYNYTGRDSYLGGASITDSNPVKALCIGLCFTGSPALGPVTGTITGGTQMTVYPTLTDVPYSNNSYQRDGITLFPLAQGNAAGGIKAFTLSSIGGIGFLSNSKQIVLDKAIPKTNLNTMSLTWRFSWSRYTPPSP